MHTLDVERYLRRIRYAGDTAPTAQTLRALQFAHLCTVPYENLDILDGIPLSLDIAALEDKIVTRGRGGFCFELNALFAALLRALGYTVTDYFSRFLYNEAELPMRRHHVLTVTSPGDDVRRLADVGVGVGSPNYPLRLQADIEQPIGERHYRFATDPSLGWVLSFRTPKAAYTPLYSFTEEPQFPIDYLATMFFCERSPLSPFNKQAMIALRTETGRYTLDGDTFKHFDGERVTVWTEDTPEARRRTLSRIFGLG